MAGHEPELDYLDYTSIRFPSDNLTIAKVRKVKPENFDLDDRPDYCGEAGHEGCAWEIVTSMMLCERLLAQAAYEEAMGRPLRNGLEYDKRDFFEELMEYYPMFGLASGARHAVELIRDFERQAVSQARAYRKEPPSVG